PYELAGLAILCSTLRGSFENPGIPAEAALRFIFALFAYFVCGLFVHEVIKNHELVIQHLAKIQMEQKLRHEAEEQLKVLVDSSPATVLTTDKNGVVLAANGAANGLFAIPDGETLRGRRIQEYLPVLAEALDLDAGQEGLRTTVQSQGYRDN